MEAKENDETTDIVAVGSGIGGCATAISSAESGARVVLLEKSAWIGGVTAFSNGKLWIPTTQQSREAGIRDSLPEAQSYIEALGNGAGESQLIERFLRHSVEALEYFERKVGFRARLMPDFADYYFDDVVGSKGTGRYLELPLIKLSELQSLREIFRYLADYSTPVLREERIASRAKPGAGNWVSNDSAAVDEDVIERRKREGWLGEGAALAAWFIRGALAAGVDIRASSPVVSLLFDGSRVSGVHVATPHGQKTIRASRAVILATGGYDWDSDLVRQYEGVLGDRNFGSACPPEITGDGLRLGHDVGGMVAALPSQMNIMQVGVCMKNGSRDQADFRGFTPFFPHSIVVNKKGMRFADEAFHPAMAAAVQMFDGATHGCPNWPAWLITDARGKDAYPIAPNVVGFESADTIAALATHCGIDPQGLTETVERFNAFCALGQDKDFHRGERAYSHYAFWPTEVHSAGPSLGALSQAPYYAVPLYRIAVGVVSAGLKTNEFGQVISIRGTAIPGLYAVGNAAARRDLGVAFQSGIANTRGMTYGYLSGRHAMGVS